MMQNILACNTHSIHRIAPNYTWDRIVLGCISILLILFVLIQMLRTCLNKHKLFSYSFLFLTLVGLWQSLRVVIWFVPIKSLCLPNLISWTVILLMFATYTLLILYFASVINGKFWETNVSLICTRNSSDMTALLQPKTRWLEIKRKTLYHFLFIVSCFTVLLFISGYNITICILELDEDKIPLARDLILYFGRIPPGVVFGVLLVLLLVYGIRLMILIRKDQTRAVLLSNIGFWSVFIVTSVNSFILFTRLFLAFGPLVIPGFKPEYMDLSFLRQSEWGKVIIILLYTYWETIPIITVLLLFGRIASVSPSKTFSKEPISGPGPRRPSEPSYNHPYPENYHHDDEKAIINSVDFENSPSMSSFNTPVNPLSPSMNSLEPSTSMNLGRTFHDSKGLLFNKTQYGTSGFKK